MITATKEELMKLTKANLIELAQKENITVDESKSKAELAEELLKAKASDAAEAPIEESQEVSDNIAEESETNEAPAEAPTDGALVKAAEEVTKTAMELELARRQARFNTGIRNEGKSSHEAFKAEFARRQAKYGQSNAEPVSVEEMQSAYASELARRAALKK